MAKNDQLKPAKPSLLKVIASTLAAFVGVQSDANRERDFQQKSIIPYLISGVFFATVFITVLIYIAKQINPSH